MTDLIKTVAVLDRTLVLHGRSVTFAYTSSVSEDDYTPAVFGVEISFQEWCDMGSPNQLTVTVEPGDNLNEAGELAGFLRTMESVDEEVENVV